MKKNENLERDDDLMSVRRCRDGDIDAFEEIVTRHQKRMFNISYRMVGDYNDAAEVVQDAFVSAYRNLGKFEGRSSLSTWLCSIVVNLSRNRIKQVKTHMEREGVSLDDPVETDDGVVKREVPSNDASVLDRLEKHEVSQRVRGCIDELADDFREVIVLRDMQGFSYSEIGTMLKIAEGTVKSRIYRARDAVKDCLKKVTGAMK
jgi:RNA polymerase sigma-70 factor (ECF subfamily)